MTTKHPPYRVGRRKAVHPFGQRGYLAHPVKRFWHHFIVAEDCRNRHDHRIGIPHPNKPIAIKVPVTITGHAAGVRAGGKFYKLVRELKVSALMKDLPDELIVNVDRLQIGKRIVAGDLKYENVNVVSPKGTIICTVKSSRQVAAHIEYEEALDEAMEEGIHHAEAPAAPAAPAAEAPAEA